MKPFRPRRITVDLLAKAYELVCSGFSYSEAANVIKCNPSYLNTLIKRCEREGIAWVK